MGLMFKGYSTKELTVHSFRRDLWLHTFMYISLVGAINAKKAKEMRDKNAI